MAEDIQLLRQYAETHANEAFAALVERHIALVYSAALRQLGGAVHRAEDVTQTVFIQLARQAAALSRREDIVGWLYTTTHHSAARLKRTEARRQRREQEAQRMQEIETNASASASAEWERLRPVLDDAMFELGEADRQAVLLRFFRNERFVDIGRKLGLSEDGARMRVDRALDQLHALLAKRGITTTTTAFSAVLANEGVVAAPAGLAATVTNAALSGAGGALAGATVLGGGSIAAALQLMSASKLALSLAAAGAAAVGFTVYQTTEASAIGAAIAQARSEYAALTARVAKLRAELNAAEEEKAGREAVAERIRVEKANAAAAASARQLAADEQRKREEKALQEFLSRDPELLKLRYDANVATYKAWNAWRPDSLAVDANGQAEKNAENAEADEAKRATGIEVPQRKPNWEAATVAHNLIPRFLHHLDEPYSSDQAARMQAVLQNAQSSSDSDVSKYAGNICAKFDWDRVLAEAVPILSSRQREALRSVAAYGRDALLRAEAAKEAAALSH